MKMKWLNRDEINTQSWDDTVNRYAQGMPYAHTFYLDAVTGGRWEALMADDESWILPLPFNRKIFGLKQYYQPFFCQQLGFIGPVLPSSSEAQIALKEVRRRSIRLFHAFNETNRLVFDTHWQPRTNLVLSLRESYEDIKRKYRKNLWQRIQKGTSLQIGFHSDFHEGLANYMDWTYPLFAKKDKVPAALISAVLQMAGVHHMCETVQAADLSGNTISGIIYLKTTSRIILLLVYQDPQYKSHNAPTFLIDAIIRKYAGSAYLLDFEGSDLESVATFYKAFGTEDSPYGTVQWRHSLLPI